MNRVFQLFVGFAVIAVTAALGCFVGLLLAPNPKDHPPPLTAMLAQDIMRADASRFDVTLQKFKVVTIREPYVRVIVTIPEENANNIPADVTYEYGWHLVKLEAPKGKLPGPG